MWTVIVTLEPSGEDIICRRGRVAREREGLRELLLGEERIHLPEGGTGADALEADVDQLPADEDQSECGTGAERRHHPAAIDPHLYHGLGERHLRGIEPRNLE